MMKRRSTVTARVRHDSITQAWTADDSAGLVYIGAGRAARGPPKSAQLWLGQRPHTPRQCLGVVHLQGKGVPRQYTRAALLSTEQGEMMSV